MAGLDLFDVSSRHPREVVLAQNCEGLGREAGMKCGLGKQVTIKGESTEWAVKVTCEAPAIRGKGERDASEEIVSVQEMVVQKKKNKIELQKGEENKALI